MMIPHGDDRYKTPDYKAYKAEKFDKGRIRANNLLSSITDSSLRKEDKKALLAEIKRIVNEFDI